MIKKTEMKVLLINRKTILAGLIITFSIFTLNCSFITNGILTHKEANITATYTKSEWKLKDFADSRYEDVRRSVAENQNTSSDVLEKLSNDDEYSVREAVAKNKRTSVKVLEKLSNDVSQRVREEVAKNENTLPSELHRNR